MNVTLIGMPGAGKSYVGEHLATTLGYTLIETDKLLEQEFELPLQDILDRFGMEAFLDREAQMVLKTTAGNDSLIISPGGSIIYKEAVMAYLRNISTIFYLKVPLTTIEERIGGKPRGIVYKENQTLEDVYAERSPLYEEWADYILDGTKTPEELLNRMKLHISL